MIHPTADVEEGARVGANTRVWHHSHIRSGATVGDNCTLGNSVYVDTGAIVGNNCKLENRVSVFRGVTLEDGVFVGPHATFTNDKHPRAVLPDGSLISEEDWTVVETLVKQGASIGAGGIVLPNGSLVSEGDWAVVETLVKQGASIGAGGIVLPGLTIGRWAMVAAGAVVTRDVPDHGLVVGHPAELTGYVCTCGRPLELRNGLWCCDNCHETYDLPPLEEAR